MTGGLAKEYIYIVWYNNFMHKILITVTVVALIGAAYLTFFSPARYGTHSDNRPCGENATKQRHYTALGFFVLTEQEKRPNTQVGTCPYQSYQATTYALELWGVGLGSIITPYLMSRPSKK